LVSGTLCNQAGVWAQEAVPQLTASQGGYHGRHAAHARM